MDTDLIIDIIRHLQWPGNDSLKSWPERDVKRPTPFWIYQKIYEERKKDLYSNPLNKIPSKNRVLNYCKIVWNSFIPRFIIDPSVFSYSMTSVIYKDDPFLSDDKFKEFSKIPNIELIQRGIGFGQFGILPVISFNILHSMKSELDHTLARLNEVSSSFREIYRGKSFIFPSKSVTENNYLRSVSMCGKDIIKKILEGLLIDPLVPLNNLSASTGIGRDRLYKEFKSFARSGLFKIEFSVSNPIVGDISLLQLGFLVENRQRKTLERNLQALPIFKERHLLSRWSFDNVLYVISWTKDYSDVLSFYLQLYKYLRGNVPLMFVWQPRTYLNRNAWLKMINSQECP